MMSALQPVPTPATSKRVTRSKTSANPKTKAAPSKKCPKSISDNDGALSEFTLFPKLPAELQLMIWDTAIAPRIVTLKPEKLPVLFHICGDSRAVITKAEYQMHIRDMKSGMVINPSIDILLLDASSFTEELGYHVNSMHTLKCRNVQRKAMKSVQRLALSAREVMEIWKSQCFHCFLMMKLEEMFPSLTELIIILRPGITGSDYSDLYEIKEMKNETMQAVIKDIQSAYDNARKEGSCKGVELKFMRNERWIH